MQFLPSRSFLKSISTAQFILPLFAILGLIGVLNHEMWRDEMNTWLIVRDSESLGEMLGYVNYQGHPALWALLVSLVQNIAAAPVAMQILHWMLGTSAVIIFWRFSRFARWQKVLFTFGYLPFYEYLLISRPYVLGMLCLFSFCALYPTRHRTYLWIAIALGLMANSHAFAALISLAAALTLAVELVIDSAQRSRYFKAARKYDFILSFLVLVALYYFAYSTMNPPLDSVNEGGQNGWDFGFDLRHLLTVLGRLLGGYTLIIPNSRRWLDLIVCDAIGIGLLVLTAIKLLRYRIPFTFYILANGILLTFFYIRYLGHGARHYGYLFLILIAALWLAQYATEPDGKVIEKLSLRGRSLSISKMYSVVFTLILLFHFGGGIARFALDLSIPFSAGRDAAQHIRQSGWQDEFIVASPDNNMAALSGYLGRPLYYPELQGVGSFTIFQMGRRTLVDHAGVLAHIEALLPTVANCRILLVLKAPLEATHPTLEVEPIAQFERSWHSSERMYLYWVTPQTATVTNCR